MLNRRNKLITVWNDLMVSKLWTILLININKWDLVSWFLCIISIRLWSVSADWRIHCASSYTKDGFWLYITQIATCSPWMFWMFINSVFHFMWVAVLIMCQLYQVRHAQVQIWYKSKKGYISRGLCLGLHVEIETLSLGFGTVFVVWCECLMCPL